VGDWAKRSLVQFNRGKNKVLHLGTNNPRQQYTAATGWKAALKERTMGY